MYLKLSQLRETILCLKIIEVILSPHSATWTNECKIRMAKLTIQNIIDFFEKKIDKSMIVKL